jgi:hypothetical protein
MPDCKTHRDFFKDSALAALGGAAAVSTAGRTTSAAPAAGTPSMSVRLIAVAM